jgi:hypothetical protein
VVEVVVAVVVAVVVRGGGGGGGGGGTHEVTRMRGTAERKLCELRRTRVC